MAKRIIAPKVYSHPLSDKDDGSWLCADGPYLSTIKSLCALYPALRVPDIRNRAIPFHERPARVAIVIIKSDFSAPCVVEYCVPRTTAALKERLAASPIQCHPDCKVERVVYLVEGLNPEIVAIFGHKLDMDPIFFVDHERTSNYQTLPYEPGLAPRLPSLMNSDETWSMTYYEIRVPPPEDELVSYSVGCGTSGRDAQRQSISSKWEQQFVLTRKCSVWKNSSSGVHSTLILCDPPFSKAHVWSRPTANGPWEIEIRNTSTIPYQGGYADILPRPNSSTWQGHGPKRHSLYGDLLYYLTRRTQELPRDAKSAVDVEAVSMRIIASHYLLLLGNYDGIICGREFPLSRRKNFSAREIANLEEQWSIIQLIRSSLDRYIQNVSLIMVQFNMPFETPGSSGPTKTPAGSQDFQYIYMQLRVLKSRADLLNESFTGLTSIVGNKRSIREAKRVKTLTLVALVFIPLSFTSALFSMYDNFLPGREQFWIFWVVALPLVIAVFALTIFLNYGYDDNGTWRPWMLWKERHSRQPWARGGLAHI